MVNQQKQKSQFKQNSSYQEGEIDVSTFLSAKSDRFILCDRRLFTP